jgi:hypothetical protein
MNDSIPENKTDSVTEKMSDVMTPGYQAEFDPDEAEEAGAFIEDALSEKDALDSDIDLVAVMEKKKA